MNASRIDPYRPANELDAAGTKRPSNAAWILASLLWLSLSLKCLVAARITKSIIEDFELEIPLLTQALLHPSTAVFLFGVTLGVFFGGLVLPDRFKRRTFARIALVLWLFAFAASFIGFVLPLVTLSRDLS